METRPPRCQQFRSKVFRRMPGHLQRWETMENNRLLAAPKGLAGNTHRFRLRRLAGVRVERRQVALRQRLQIDGEF